MSTKKGLGRPYDRLTPEERFRLDVLALARGDEEESERLTATCPRRAYTMNDWGFVGRWEAARVLAMLAYVDVARPMDKIKMIDAFRSIIPYLSTIWEDDVHGPTLTATRRGAATRGTVVAKRESRPAGKLTRRRRSATPTLP
jgi:hypothetical protein